MVLEGHTSSLANVSSGVPQGSILGPLLFVLYMDSINHVPLSPDSKLLLYADDILLYSPIRQPSDITTCQLDVDSISHWVSQSGLRLSIAKTKLVMFSRQRHPPPFSLTLVLEGIQIPQVDSVKYLGVILSKDSSWTRHINSVCTDAKHRVGLLHRQFGLAGIPCLTQIYKTLILPFLDYCSCVWDPSYVLHTDKLESVQHFATKIITQQWNSRYDDRLKLLKLSRLSTLRKRQKMSLCYRIVTGRSFIPSSFFLYTTPVLTCAITTICHYTALQSELLPISLPFLLVSFHSGIPFTVTLFPLLVVILSNHAYL